MADPSVLVKVAVVTVLHRGEPSDERVSSAVTLPTPTFKSALGCCTPAQGVSVLDRILVGVGN